jgi:hypothetical protein
MYYCDTHCTVGRGKGDLVQLRVKDIEELTNINYVEENEEIEIQIEVPIIETDTPLILEEEIIPMEIDETNVMKKIKTQTYNSRTRTS